jgi:hypothetical protein
VRACFMLARVRTPSVPVRERERKRVRVRKRVRKIEREREKEREYLFLKGMTGALAPFSYLVYNILHLKRF